MGMIDSITLTLVSRALDAASMRHAAHAQNIANANVDGARRVQVSFEDQMDAVRTSLLAGQPVNPGDVPTARVVQATDQDGARIQLDGEVAALSRNALHYQALVRALGRHISMLSLAVNDGRR